MKLSTIKVLSTVAILAAPLISPAIAGDKEGFYTTLSIGRSAPAGDDKNEILPILTGLINQGNTPSIDTNLGAGIKYEGGIGYDFGRSRIEVTYDYAKTDLESLSLSGLNIGDPRGGFIGDLDPGFGDGDNMMPVVELQNIEIPPVGIEGGDRTTKSLMVSGFYDIETDSKFTPYIGGGLGVSFIETGSWTVDDGLNPEDCDGECFADEFPLPSTDKSVFTWQLQAGLAYDLSDSVDLTADVTYKDTADYSFGIMDVKPAALVSIEAGVRFYF